MLLTGIYRGRSDVKPMHTCRDEPVRTFYIPPRAIVGPTVSDGCPKEPTGINGGAGDQDHGAEMGSGLSCT